MFYFSFLNDLKFLRVSIINRGDISGFIDFIHKQQISYNLIYAPGKVYCLPRKHQGTYPDANWSSGFAWYEVSGGFTTFNHSQFMELNCQQLEQELSLLKLEPD